MYTHQGIYYNATPPASAVVSGRGGQPPSTSAPRGQISPVIHRPSPPNALVYTSHTSSQYVTPPKTYGTIVYGAHTGHPYAQVQHPQSSREYAFPRNIQQTHVAPVISSSQAPRAQPQTTTTLSQTRHPYSPVTSSGYQPTVRQPSPSTKISSLPGNTLLAPKPAPYVAPYTLNRSLPSSQIISSPVVTPQRQYQPLIFYHGQQYTSPQSRSVYITPANQDSQSTPKLGKRNSYIRVKVGEDAQKPLSVLNQIPEQQNSSNIQPDSVLISSPMTNSLGASPNNPQGTIQYSNRASPMLSRPTQNATTSTFTHISATHSRAQPPSPINIPSMTVSSQSNPATPQTPQRQQANYSTNSPHSIRHFSPSKDNIYQPQRTTNPQSPAKRVHEEDFLDKKLEPVLPHTSLPSPTPVNVHNPAHPGAIQTSPINLAATQDAPPPTEFKVGGLRRTESVRPHSISLSAHSSNEVKEMPPPSPEKPPVELSPATCRLSNQRDVSYIDDSTLEESLAGVQIPDYASNVSDPPPALPSQAHEFISPGTPEKKESTEPMIKAVQLGNYVIHKTIGTGGCALVRLAIHEPSGMQVALKTFAKSNRTSEGRYVASWDEIQQEMKILHFLDHPNIIRMYEVLQTADDINIVMDYCLHGDLYTYCVANGLPDEWELRRLFVQMLDSVEYCHKMGFVHRDLKAENFLLDANLNVKLSDFGLSAHMGDGVFLVSTYLSLPYCAPEMLRRRTYTGFGADVWSLGILLFFLTAGIFPFRNSDEEKLYEEIEAGKFKCPEFMSPELEDLIRHILEVDMNRRYTIKDIRAHPWMQLGLQYTIIFVSETTTPDCHQTLYIYYAPLIAMSTTSVVLKKKNPRQFYLDAPKSLVIDQTPHQSLQTDIVQVMVRRKIATEEEIIAEVKARSLSSVYGTYQLLLASRGF